jgi:uncharacterized protein (DUF488 family)
MKQIFTIGHSTHSIDEFVKRLKAHGVELVIDVRRFPGSRRYPQFNKDSFAESMESEGIGYVHLESLGGRRKARPDSRNTAWRNESFRGYADYMETEEFARAAKELTELAREKIAAIMCSESLWWRCHRSMIADYLKAGGWQVTHIIDEKKTEEHPFTSPARVHEGKLVYVG